jgi:hypothetical protein
VRFNVQKLEKHILATNEVCGPKRKEIMATVALTVTEGVRRRRNKK